MINKFFALFIIFFGFSKFYKVNIPFIEIYDDNSFKKKQFCLIKKILYLKKNKYGKYIDTLSDSYCFFNLNRMGI